MNTVDLRNATGELYAFEIPNIGRGAVCRIASRVPNVQILRRPKFLSWFREEEFCEFVVDGVRFVAWEPFGDNSRYWIGPQPLQRCDQLVTVRDVFADVRWTSWLSPG